MKPATSLGGFWFIVTSSLYEGQRAWQQTSDPVIIVTRDFFMIPVLKQGV
jgi:hypothetical protein